MTLILSTLSLFIEMAKECKIISFIVFLVIIAIIYIVLWIRANRVETGDIFEYAGLKVIAFNEYFDTVVDNCIISETSLKGYFIKNKVKDTDLLDREIESDEWLKEK